MGARIPHWEWGTLETCTRHSVDNGHVQVSRPPVVTNSTLHAAEMRLVRAIATITVATWQQWRGVETGVQAVH